MENVTVDRRSASTYCFCPRVLGPIERPRLVRTRSSRTSVGRISSSFTRSMVWPTDDSVSTWPRTSSVSSSSNSVPTFSASPSRPVIVISLPRTTIWESKASSTSFSSSSVRPRRATIGWLPGTRILTCVVAFAKSYVPGTSPRSFSMCETGSRPRDPGLPRLYVRRWPGPVSGPRSSRGPPHPAAAQPVEVQVADGLAGSGTGVRDQAPSGAVDPLGPGHVRRGHEQVGQHLPVALAEPPQRADVLPRDQQDVDRGPGRGVAEGHDVVGGMDHVRRLFLRRDPAEGASRLVGHGWGLRTRAGPL